MLHPTAWPLPQAHFRPFMRSIVLQDLKHSREGLDKSGIDGRCLDGRCLNGRCLDRKGLNKRGIDGRADDVRENHRLQHSNVTGKFLSIKTLRITLCTFCAEDYMQHTDRQLLRGHQAVPRGYWTKGRPDEGPPDRRAEQNSRGGKQATETELLTYNPLRKKCRGLCVKS